MSIIENGVISLHRQLVNQAPKLMNLIQDISPFHARSDWSEDQRKVFDSIKPKLKNDGEVGSQIAQILEEENERGIFRFSYGASRINAVLAVTKIDGFYLPKDFDTVSTFVTEKILKPFDFRTDLGSSGQGEDTSSLLYELRPDYEVSSWNPSGIDLSGPRG